MNPILWTLVLVWVSPLAPHRGDSLAWNAPTAVPGFTSEAACLSAMTRIQRDTETLMQPSYPRRVNIVAWACVPSGEPR